MTHLEETNPKAEGLKVAAWFNKRRGGDAPPDPVSALRESYADDSPEATEDERPAPAAPPVRRQRTLADARRELAERAAAAAPPPPSRSPARQLPAAGKGGGGRTGGSSMARLAGGALGVIRGEK